MNRGEIISLANDFIHDVGALSTLEESYTDTLERFAKGSAPFVDSESFTPTDGVSEYSYPSSAVTILGVFYGTRHLAFASAKDLEAYSADWRSTAEDEPYVFTFYEEDARTVKIFPTPSTTTVDGGTFLFSEQRTLDIADWIVLPIIFEMLFEELSYPSDHQDKEMATVCATLGRFFRLFTGVL